MKNIWKHTAVSTLLVALIFSLSFCNKDKDDSPSNDDNAVINVANLQLQVNNLPNQPISPEERTSLVFMREEEKLARDVYISLYNKWGSRIFNNISSSEQTHMEAVLILLNKYGIPDPVGSNPIGVFNNAALQTLYNELVANGKWSVLDAYKVGATIEDLDIFDLQNAMALVDNQDIELVYSMLTKGSRNHLRAFYSNILKVGGSYTPQYLSQTEFDLIINSSMETGF